MRSALAALLLTVVSTLSLSAANPGTTVIDREMIEHYHFTSVARAIETVAGMDVLRTYFKQNVVTARGILQEHYANKVLLMIDGVPTWNAVTGEPIIDRINIEDVERLEITKGPSSVAYGDNAYVAAINIVLRRATADDFNVRAAAGTNSVFLAGGNATAKIHDVELFVAANGRSDAGRERTIIDERGQQVQFDDYLRDNNFTLQLRSAHHNFLFNGATVEESFLGNTPDLQGGLGLDHKSRGYLAAYDGEHALAPADLRYHVLYDATTRNFARTGDNLIRGNVEGRRLNGGIDASLRSDGPLKIEGGADAERMWSDEYDSYEVRTGRVLDDNNMRDRSIDEWSAFGRASWEHPSWSAEGGVRYTHHELFGGNTSGEFQIGHVLPRNGRITLMAGRSYRAPSIFELYFHTSSNTVFGNSELKPETNTTVQAVYEFKHDAFQGKATLYHARYGQKIFRTRRLPNDPVDRSLIYINGEDFSANGLELEGRTSIHALDLFATYSYVDGDDGDRIPGTEHYNFRYVPSHAASAGASYTFGPWSGAGMATWRSSTNGPLAPVGASADFDFDFGYSHRFESMNMRHALVLSNAFDEDGSLPETVRRNLNEIPGRIGRRVMYMVTVKR
jgi:outer membrane cobalamin receptor